MSKLDWRNNKFEKLIGDSKDETVLPTYAQYLVWQGNTERAITAVGADYINQLIERLEERWDGTALPVLGEDENIPDIPNSASFKKALVDLVLLCGREFPMVPADQANSSAVIKTRYDIVFLELTSFGQQVSASCQKHYPEIFNDSEIKHTRSATTAAERATEQ
mmetsp:Transcript_30956/g.64227  ORF Transcript_30956/g.64227 Transcript_30956/m.64227 type:complete len:164 (-) Transcript_30956:195-686(-)